MMNMEYVLTTHNVSKYYHSAMALSNATINVPKGAVYGLVGLNGAGKTTLMRVVCGLQLPSTGYYELYGVRNTDKQISKMRRRVGAVIEKPAFYPNMTAKKNLIAQYKMLGLPVDETVDELLDMVGLGNTGAKRAGKFSLGMKQRLGIAIALAGFPDFLILDEPINGLDPEGIVEIREMILKLNREKGITVLISSHILSELSLLATHYGFVNKGKVVKEISAEELNRQARKCMVAEVSDVQALSMVLEKQGIEFEIISDNKAKIFEKMSVTLLSEQLSAKGCELIGVTEADESLESYFLDLVGGGRNG